MNRLKKEICNAPRQSSKIDRLRTYADDLGLDRNIKATGVDGKGYWASRIRLYVAIYNYCNS